MTSPAARPLRVVYVWDADYPWDVRVEKTCRALTDAGHDVHIVARNKAWRDEREVRPEGTVHRMPRWRAIGQRADRILGFPAFFSPRWWSLISRVVREVGADVIIARDLPLCPTALAVGKHLGVPVILDMAEDYPAITRAKWTAGRATPIDHLVRNPRAVEMIERYCLRRVARTWVVSDFLRNRFAADYGAEFFDVIGNTPPRSNTDIGVTRPSRGWLEIVYLGIIEIPRGIGDLIDAIALLREDNFSVRLRLVGSGRDEAVFRSQIRSLNLADDVVDFVGYVPYGEALRLIASSDIGAMPLHRDAHHDSTIPNKLFDYMSIGLPILTSNVTASAQLVQELGVGDVFEAGNARSLANAIIRLESGERRAAMAQRGRTAVRDRFNWESDSRRAVESVSRVATVGALGKPR